MSPTDISLCSMSLMKVGAAPIAGFDGTTSEAEIAKALFEPTLQAMLVGYPWAFSLTQIDIDPLVESPFPEYEYAYQLPTDSLRTISAQNSVRRNCIYKVMGSLILSDSERLTLTYQCRPDTSIFPAHFVQAFTARLAAEFCLPLTESSSRSDVLHKLAAVELRLARLIDSQQATSHAIDDYTLIGVRGR